MAIDKKESLTKRQNYKKKKNLAIEMDTKLINTSEQKLIRDKKKIF